REIRETLERMGGANGRCFHEEYLKLALDRLTREAGVNLLLHAAFAGANVEDGRIASIRVSTKAGMLDLAADNFIDATGDADVAVAAGCPYHLGRPDGLCQPMTLCFR
ncbi:MAG TPA: FAD-dependent oxidoreductase, partial [Clostridia bacterium]|nr:FAD-dependent oxidoreductase [Clostridia bacterium]